MKIIVEYRPLIRSDIAEIINSLSNSDSTICWRAITTLSNLSQQGKFLKSLVLALLIINVAKFRPLIRPALPVIVNLLKDGDQSVYVACLNSLETFSAQGKTVTLLGPLCLQ